MDDNKSRSTGEAVRVAFGGMVFVIGLEAPFLLFSFQAPASVYLDARMANFIVCFLGKIVYMPSRRDFDSRTLSPRCLNRPISDRS